MQTSYELSAENGTTVHTYGCITLNLDLGPRRDFTCRFVFADVRGSIIGSDFLSFYNLLVDIDASLTASLILMQMAHLWERSSR
jgi:hypothetical protein